MTDAGKLAPGMILAERYELTEVVGQGGFGMVYRARQINMDRDVAVKILPPQFMMIPDVVERFKQEARLASRLRHPNTVTLHDWGDQDGFLYIVMELLTGEDLADVLRRERRVEVERALHIARQALKSLDEAHSHQIIHRDLKPENIFLANVGSEKDFVKILDFGIAKLIDKNAPDDTGRQRQLTIAGSTVGTPTYMSPEQAAGEEVDARSDIYTMGIILYEMLCGRPPFYSRDPVKVMRAHLFEEPPALRDEKLQGTLLEKAIHKALAKELTQRFQSAEEFLLALGQDVVARPREVMKKTAPGGLRRPSVETVPADLMSFGQVPRDPIRGAKESSENASIAAPVLVDSTEIEVRRQTGQGQDAIPFERIPEADSSKERATVRSGLTERSGLTSSSDLHGIPQGFADSSAVSSIITVIEPAEPREEEVILLTRPKEAEEVLLDRMTEVSQESEELAPADEWSWGEEGAERHTGEHLVSTSSGIELPTVKRSSRSAIVYLLFVLILVAAAVFFFLD